MRVLENLHPKDVFHYFEDICSIPHGSGNTQGISNYCVNFARSHGLRFRQEDCGNVIIFKDASAGYENAPTVILQGHMDMVAVHDDDYPIDMENEGLKLKVDGDWISAGGTSLGGDDGIALAYAMAILADDSLDHPALEAVFTVDEEVGLLGAAALDTSDLKGEILMNMDSEDDGIFLTGCAGGATAKAELFYDPIFGECSPKANQDDPGAPCDNKLSSDPFPMTDASGIGVLYRLDIRGLEGGHSGTGIIFERANAIVIFGRILSELSERFTIMAGNINGGEKDNVIARFCHADIALLPAKNTKDLYKDNYQFINEFESEFEKIKQDILKEYSFTDPGMSISLKLKEDKSPAAGSGNAAAASKAWAGLAVAYMSASSKTETCEALSNIPSAYKNEEGEASDMMSAASRNSICDAFISAAGSICPEKGFLSPEKTRALGLLISLTPAGIQRRMPQMPELVQTSLNAGIIKQEDDRVIITTSVRSSIESEKSWLLKQMENITIAMGGKFSVSGIYPAWEYREDSVIRPLMTETYRQLTGKDAVCCAIHAGVECGFFCGKMPQLDCISYGPQMEDIHTTNEKLSISSVERNYTLTKEVLKKIKPGRKEDM